MTKKDKIMYGMEKVDGQKYSSVSQMLEPNGSNKEQTKESSSSQNA